MKKKLLMFISILIFVVVVVSIFINGGIRPINNRSNYIAVIGGGTSVDKVNWHQEGIDVRTYNVVNDTEILNGVDEVTTMSINTLYNDIFSIRSDADLMLIQAFLPEENVQDDVLAKALDRACQEQARVVYLTVGIDTNFTASLAAIERCVAEETVIITSSIVPASGLFNPLANAEGVIFVTTQKENIEGQDIKVDTSQQVACVGAECQVKRDSFIAGAYVSQLVYEKMNTLDYSKVLNEFSSELAIEINYYIQALY